MSLDKDLKEELIKEIIEWQERKKHMFNGFLKPFTCNQLCDMNIGQLKNELENIVMKK